MFKPIKALALATALALLASPLASSPAQAEESTPASSTLTAGPTLAVPEQSVALNFLPDNENLHVLQDNSWKTTDVAEEKLGVFYGFSPRRNTSLALNNQIVAGPYEATAFSDKYAVIYNQGRNAQSASVALLDITNGKTLDTFTNFAKYPNQTSITKATNSIFYVANKSFVYKIDADARQVETTNLNLGKSDNLTSPQYDPNSQVLYLINKNFKTPAIKKYDTQTSALLDFSQDLKAPQVADFVPNSKPKSLTLDAEKNRLYVLYSQPYTSTDKRDFIAVYDTANDTFLEHVIFVPTDTSSIVLNPVSHELLVSSNTTNSITVVNPARYTATVALNLENELVPAEKADAPESAKANLAKLVINAPATTAYALSVFPTKTVTDGSSSVTQIQVSSVSDVFADQSQPQPKPEQPNKPETKPANPYDFEINELPELTVTDADTKIENAKLNWNFTDYAKLWWNDKETIANASNQNQEYAYTAGTGQANSKTGEIKIGWHGAVVFNPYSFVPNMLIVFANPIYTKDATGKESISFEMYWNLGDGSKKADSFRRIDVLNESLSDKAKVNLENGATINMTPAFADVTYTDQAQNTYTGAFPTEFIDNFIQDMRPWWYLTGASRDTDKTPQNVTIDLISVKSLSNSTEESTEENTQTPPATPAESENNKESTQPVAKDNHSTPEKTQEVKLVAKSTKQVAQAQKDLPNTGADSNTLAIMLSLLIVGIMLVVVSKKYKL